MRYHLNIRNATGLIVDEEGAEFPNLRAAKVEARASAAELLVDDLRGDRMTRYQRIEISDDDGNTVASVGFSVLLHDNGKRKGSSSSIGHRKRVFRDV